MLNVSKVSQSDQNFRQGQREIHQVPRRRRGNNNRSKILKRITKLNKEKEKVEKLLKPSPNYLNHLNQALQSEFDKLNKVPSQVN